MYPTKESTQLRDKNDELVSPTLLLPPIIIQKVSNNPSKDNNGSNILFPMEPDTDNLIGDDNSPCIMDIGEIPLYPKENSETPLKMDDDTCTHIETLKNL